MSPNYFEASLDKGLSLRKFGKDYEAIECYDKALQVDPNNAYAWNSKGESFRNLEKYKEAIECYDKALQIDATNRTLL